MPTSSTKSSRKVAPKPSAAPQVTASIWNKLNPDYIRERAARGKPVPAEYADTSKPRLYFSGRHFGHPEISLMVKHYDDQKACYSLWLALDKGVRCAMRNAHETMPVYSHDLVDRP